MIAVAASGTTLTVGIIITIVCVTASAVMALMRVNGDTRDAIEDAADKRVSEARTREDQLISIGKEWREQWQAVEELRAKQDEKHARETAVLRDQLDDTRTRLAVAERATDLSGLEERLNTRFDSFLTAQQQQTEVLGVLIETVNALNERASTTNGGGS